MSKKINPNRAPLRSLAQDLKELGLFDHESPAALGPEHVLREDSHLEGGDFGLRARVGDDTFYVYTWKPRVSVHTIGMTKDEALKLAALINKTYPLDALGRI